MVNSDELSQLASLGPSWQVQLWAAFFKWNIPVFVVWLAEIGKRRRSAVRVFHYCFSRLPFGSLFFSYLLFHSWCPSPHPLLQCSSSVNWIWSFTRFDFPLFLPYCGSVFLFIPHFNFFFLTMIILLLLVFGIYQQLLTVAPWT